MSEPHWNGAPHAGAGAHIAALERELTEARAALADARRAALEEAARWMQEFGCPWCSIDCECDQQMLKTLAAKVSG